MTDERKIELDIGAALQMLQSSPELADEFSKLLAPAYADALKKSEVELTRLTERVKVLEATLSVAEGYLLNAKIDLETGAPKRTAIRTIDGGLKVVCSFLRPNEGEAG